VLTNEAEWICKCLMPICHAATMTSLNLGCGDLDGCRVQGLGRIESVLPNISHLDIRPVPGGICGDICDPRIRNLGSFDVILCTSVLEHTRRPLSAIDNVAALARDYLIVTVPCNWPAHGDFDNGYRSSPEELAQSVEQLGFNVMEAVTIPDNRSNCIGSA
jgi:hypothetical protein